MKTRLENRINALLISARATNDADTLNNIRLELKKSGERYLLLIGKPYIIPYSEENEALFYTETKFNGG